MTPARFALTEAFGLFLHGADNDSFDRPTAEQERLSAAIPKSRQKRIKRADIDGVNVIIEMPSLNIATGKNTWIGRTSTSHRCAVAIDAGKMMAAALNQDELKARWLEYVYDPYFDIDQDRRNRMFRQVIFPGVCMMWSFWPHKRVRPTPAKFNRFVTLIGQCIASYSRYARSGNKSMKLTATQKAGAMGYGSRLNGRISGAWDAANWKAQWSGLDADVMRLLEELDETAIAPVVVAFTRQLELRRAERGIFIA